MKKIPFADILFIIFALANAYYVEFPKPGHSFPPMQHYLFYVGTLNIGMWAIAGLFLLANKHPWAIRLIGINRLGWVIFSHYGFLKSLFTGKISFPLERPEVIRELFFFKFMPITFLVLAGIGLLLIKEFGRASFLASQLITLSLTLYKRFKPLFKPGVLRMLMPYGGIKPFLMPALPALLAGVGFSIFSIYYFCRPLIKKLFIETVENGVVEKI